MKLRGDRITLALNIFGAVAAIILAVEYKYIEELARPPFRPMDILGLITPAFAMLIVRNRIFSSVFLLAYLLLAEQAESNARTDVVYETPPERPAAQQQQQPQQQQQKQPPRMKA